MSEQTRHGRGRAGHRRRERAGTRRGPSPRGARRQGRHRRHRRRRRRRRSRRRSTGRFVATDVSDLDANVADGRGRRRHLRRARPRLPQRRRSASFTASATTSTCELYRRAMGVNLDGVVFGVHAVLPALRARGGGAIVATASLAGLTAVPFDPIYAANKHGVVGLVRSLGFGLPDEGIRVNAVCPGFAESKIIDPIREALGSRRPADHPRRAGRRRGPRRCSTATWPASAGSCRQAARARRSASAASPARASDPTVSRRGGAGGSRGRGRRRTAPEVEDVVKPRSS